MTDIQDALHRAGIALFQDGDVTGALEKLAAALALAAAQSRIGTRTVRGERSESVISAGGV